MEARSGGRANVGDSSVARYVGLDAVLIRRGGRVTKLPFLAVEHEARTVMSADGTAATNWLRGGKKAATREYDALPTHHMSAPLAGMRMTCRDADDRTQ